MPSTESGFALPRGLLLTDLYQLNMMQAYLDNGMTGTAVFEFFVRKLPPERNFLVAAGLEQVIDYLSHAHAAPEELQWMKDSGRFSVDFIDYLERFRFAGDVHAMPEGTVVFADEPILRVTAPLPMAQLFETRVINLMHVATLVASKAARMVLAAPGKRLIDFGLRRAHGWEAGLLAARAAYIAGFAGTATVPAAPLWDIPIAGTMAHSFIEAHDNEMRAFLDFARARPKDVVFLIDTYDTEAAARRVVELAPQLAAEGIEVQGVRIDSGDLAEQARRVRQILDQGGLGGVPVVASGGLDEWSLREHVANNVPIDGYGIGTSLTTSEDAPALNCAYKLQEYDGRYRRKLSSGKATWPGRKQVWRRYNDKGIMVGDTIGLETETQSGTPLVDLVMTGGQRVSAPPGLSEIRARAAGQIAALPGALRELRPAKPYSVAVSRGLQREANAVAANIAARNQ